jgi:2-keto-4-pentenoate hydratase
LPDAAELAQLLDDARRRRIAVPPISSTYPDLTIDDAYAIQRELVDLLLVDGGQIVGWKLGLTSKPMQDLLGVNEPDYGPVLSTMVFEDGVTLDLDEYIQPKVEAEILLVLDKPLRGPGLGAADAAQAVSGAMAAIEMVDSRIEDWKIGLVDTVADLASSAATVRGSRVVPIESDVRLTGMVITKNGETVATGAGAAALGDPMFAVAWLANTLAPYNVTLEPGQFIMTGSLHAAFDVAPHDVVVAEFDRLGTVTMKCAGSA